MASQQQYCLRWNNYQNNLAIVLDQLLQNENLVDVTLACEGHAVKAHRVILAACSPYFQALFADTPCQHPIVILRDVGWPELKAVLEFVYKGEISVSQDQLGPLLKVADALKIRGLADVGREPTPSPCSYLDERVGMGMGMGLTSASSCELDTSRTSSPPLRKKRRRLSDEVNAVHSAAGSPPESPAPSGPVATDILETTVELGNTTPGLLSPKGTSSPATPSPPNTSSGCLAASVSAGNQVVSSLSMSGSMAPSSSTSSGSNPAASSVSHAHSLVNAGGASVSITPASMSAAHASAPTSSTSAVSASNVLQSGPAAQSASSLTSSSAADLDLKPGIVEMIREEERAKMLESSHSWLGATVSPITVDSYQYQLQSMWQKCWSANANPSLLHSMRFRERGPLKSWRPETMAEAILAVLKEGLSLSQAARKYDIPYPTFVLYANRVHNMLGPSTDGAAENMFVDLRPKGRGRPQRILLGSWPEDHIQGVIRAVVFRETPALKEETNQQFSQEPGNMNLNSNMTMNMGPNVSMSLNSAPHNMGHGLGQQHGHSGIAGVNMNMNMNVNMGAGPSQHGMGLSMALAGGLGPLNNLQAAANGLEASSLADVVGNGAGASSADPSLSLFPAAPTPELCPAPPPTPQSLSDVIALPASHAYLPLGVTVKTEPCLEIPDDDEEDDDDVAGGPSGVVGRGGGGPNEIDLSSVSLEPSMHRVADDK